MTAEGSTGAPLRQQIAEALDQLLTYDNFVNDGLLPEHMADAVVTLLNLTEETEWAVAWHEDDEHPERCRDESQAQHLAWIRDDQCGPISAHVVQRSVRTFTGPWLPSTPPDTSSSETT